MSVSSNMGKNFIMGYNQDQTLYNIPAKQSLEAAEPREVDTQNVPAPQAQANTVPAHPQVRLVNQQAVQVLLPQLTQPAAQVQTTLPQPKITELSSIQCSFLAQATNFDHDNKGLKATIEHLSPQFSVDQNDKGPKATIEHLSTQFSVDQITLKRLHLTLVILHILEKSNLQASTTTSAVTTTTSSKAASAGFEKERKMIKELLQVEFKGNPEAIAQEEAFLESMFRLNAKQVKEALAKWEQQQADLLTKCDKVANQTVYHDPCPEQFENSNKIRCLTWIVKSRENGDEYVIGPYFTNIVNKKMHCMNYLIWRADNLASRTLKVVVADFLCEIPFSIQVPKEQEYLNVVILAIPKVTRQKSSNGDNLSVDGFKLVIYELKG